MFAHAVSGLHGYQGIGRLVVAGTLSRNYGPNVIGHSVSAGGGSNYLTSGATRLPTGKWTIAAVIRCNSSWLADQTAIGYAESPGAGAFDRSIKSASGFWGGYLYDGAAKNVATGRTIVANEWATIVVTTNGSTLDAHVNGGSSGSVAVSNSGYTGYATPEFLIGNSASTGIDSTVALCLLLEDYWEAGKSRAWIDNPWQVFQPLPRRVFAVSTAVGGGGLVANPLFGGGTAANPLWGYVA
jgi:hypothetical protein